MLIKNNLSCFLFYKINTRYFSALFEQIRRNNFYISMKNWNSSFFPKTIVEWKKLDSGIQNVSSSGLKKHLIKEIKLTSNLSLNIYDPNFLKLITKLRLGLSHLIEYKSSHNSENCLSPKCFLNCHFIYFDKKKLFLKN